ncbi:MAG TPA: hypothetical protein VK821_14375 [Dehalococcoidia bacterium]|nr:hypothetical protein [Dehalococcoidia bacterium]
MVEGGPTFLELAKGVHHEEAALTALGIAEVLDHVQRLASAEEDDAALDLAQLRLGAPPALDTDIAVRAGLLRARHYQRRN